MISVGCASATVLPWKYYPDTSSVTEQCPENRRQIGVISASFLIFNRIMGTGIFATPSAILALTGSVGLSLIVWVMGMVIAMTGTAVYLEFGTTIPRNGGEKNYLEYVYTKPRFLVTAMFASYALFLGWAAGNSIAFGEYVLHAADIEVNRWNQRGIGFACITLAFLIHATAVKWGLRLQNLLGALKFLVILIIVAGGAVALGGHLNMEKPDNFSRPFEGSIPSVYGIVTALYSVIWSYVGYSNANYSLSETKNPARTLKIAAPIGVGLASVLYMLVNVAYFVVVPKQEILGSGRILAASFFRNVFGPKAERVLSIFIALCAFGNVQSVIFSQGRIIQELGREGVLPFSRFWASNRPFNSPAAGLFEHYLISAIVMLAPPPGDAYNFLLNLISYPLSVVNIFVSAGLLHIYMFPKSYPDWSPTVRASRLVTIFFLLSNVFLAVAPYLPPPDKEHNVYVHLPYYIHCVVGLGIFAAGAIYWLFWAAIFPWVRKYRLVQQTVIAPDGWSRQIITRVPIGMEEKGKAELDGGRSGCDG
ncbi:high-affinity methionine permease [Histoplasma capsulatum var. duboisii H88]|uniref:High-affinity methionine permease n=1 Tax=Ajellomyces capsulatus (strain H88) TaxID=544711 RepID=F0U6C0_AJEC8|nr:high-affinity methionine permease [Histoplasma capsulatum var. duboisii H88]